MGLFIPFTLVSEAGVPNRANDVGEPVEASQTLKGLAAGGVSDSGDGLLQLAVEERVVLLGIEAEVGFGKEVSKPKPVPKGLHDLCRAPGVGSSAAPSRQDVIPWDADG